MVVAFLFIYVLHVRCPLTQYLLCTGGIRDNGNSSNDQGSSVPPLLKLHCNKETMQAHIK